MQTSPYDIPRMIFAVLFIGGFIASSLWILRPFLPAAIWATMIVVATWPFLLRLEGWLRGRRGLAVAVMTVALLLVFVIPFSLAIGKLVGNAERIAGWASAIGQLKLPAPPEWLQSVPFVGGRIARAWNDLLVVAPEDLARRLAPYAGALVRHLLDMLGDLGMVTVQFLLTVIIAAVLYASGETVVGGLRQFARRLAGAHGDNAISIAGQAIRGVALGVVVTALVQSLLGGIGLVVAGVPFPGILTTLMFLLAVAQIGPGPVLLAAIVWLFWSGATGWGTAMVVWAIFVGTMDNVLRPILIKRGADLPLLLILTGVVGGLLAFGLVGLFVGPLILAVAYRLLEAWVSEELGEAGPP
jgi:predicted PurR-regulated permease PerM